MQLRYQTKEIQFSDTKNKIIKIERGGKLEDWIQFSHRDESNFVYKGKLRWSPFDYFDIPITFEIPSIYLKLDVLTKENG